MASYYSHDFDFDEWATSCQLKYSLPEIDNTLISHHETTDSDSWNRFYDQHDTAQVYKPRNYIYPEFQSWFEYISTIPIVEAGDSSVKSLVVEIGCGHGCTIFPLLPQINSSVSFIASECSSSALQLFQEHELFNAERVFPLLWDCTTPWPSPQEHHTSPPIRAVLSIFTMSAVHPDQHTTVFRSILAMLAPGGVFLFRDYAVNDMTMFRHRVRLAPLLFRRTDGTLAYYFDLQYIRDMASSIGFEVCELEYACVSIVNRRAADTSTSAATSSPLGNAAAASSECEPCIESASSVATGMSCQPSHAVATAATAAATAVVVAAAPDISICPAIVSHAPVISDIPTSRPDRVRHTQSRSEGHKRKHQSKRADMRRVFIHAVLRKPV